MVLRERYLDKLIQLRDKQLIKVVTGVRRCGKSTLLLQFQNYLKKQGVAPEQIIALNFEDIVNEELLDAPELLNSQCYDAWIIKVEGVTATEELLDADGYEAFCQQEG